jgi:hypothetical protein
VLWTITALTVPDERRALDNGWVLDDGVFDGPWAPKIVQRRRWLTSAGRRQSTITVDGERAVGTDDGH